ncbi:hypothetical protein BDN70DRAFT_938314 [Pholiota conissans]|uniref:Uncharacterized protein n=1 Tax=Pholiota conissans TaxID=109636 RepID=A0A9P5YNM0_9AGAR|nr:hypothetical protein BDN70DRAFT_938314 [Pholiota conissans]
MVSRISHPSLSPIDKLPYDALREIFMHGVPTYPNILNHRFEMTLLILNIAMGGGWCSSETSILSGEQLVDEDAFTFILEYLALVQYFDVNAIIWDTLATPKITCPNLSTVVLHSDGCNSEDKATVSNFQSVLGLTATPPLQRLSMLNFKLSPENALTHFLFENFFRTDTKEISERIGLHRLDCPIRKLTVVTENLWDATENITTSEDLVLYETREWT